MRFLPLILKSILRNSRRTALMAAGIAISLFVISALLAVEAGFGAVIGSAQESLLNVREKGVACPISSRVLDAYLAPIGRTPGVLDATGVLRGLYTYQDKENVVVVNGVDYEPFRRLKEIVVVEGSEGAFAARPDGALVGRPVASQYGWKVGQTVSLLEDRLTFTVSGLFTADDKGFDTGVLLHKEYLAKLKRDEGKSTFLIVRLDGPSSAAAVSRSIDAEFSNHPKPTKTQSERAAREGEMQDFRDVRRMLGLMILATIVVSIFGAANGVSMSVRERTREVGILRSLGLRKGQILGILVGEAVVLAIGGGAAGVGLAQLFLTADRTLGGIVPLAVPPANLLVAAAASVGIGLIGAAVPALRATRIPIVDCLKLAE